MWLIRTADDVDVVDELPQLREHAVAAVEQQTNSRPSCTRYPLHAPPASCQEGDLPNTVIRNPLLSPSSLTL